ncbi:MAG: prepilin-type N-terminal cleavage/methylation domain-containing protein [Candidatus Pacebacteria bacterium]|nr:prepilin-type N-terminal cleavage/methylation domain-containing protein [Candidatus Paceibacterota bacterium]
MNCDKQTKYNKGVSLIEILVAIGVFAISTTAIIFLLIDGVYASGRSLQLTQAILLAHEGIDATRSILENDFDNALSGEHGIELVDGVWILSGLSDTQNEFTRCITITNIDDDTKKIGSEVVWGQESSRPGSILITGHVTDWKQTKGDAEYLFVETLSAFLTSSSTRLEGVTLNNTGESAIAIETIQTQWSGGALLYEIGIGSSTVFSVPPLSGIFSGQEADITNYTLTALSGTTSLDAMVFTEEIVGTTMIITFIMSDGSTRHSFIEF